MRLKIGLEGRFVTGKASFKVSLENGLLLVFADSVIVNGQPLPEQVMIGLRNINLAARAMEKKETIEKLRKIGGLVVKDGVVYLTGSSSIRPVCACQGDIQPVSECHESRAGKFSLTSPPPFCYPVMYTL